MYKDFIKKNINKLDINHIRKFADKNNIFYTDNELNIIYNFIISNYQELLNENIKIFELIKNDINPSLYKYLLNLYIDYKEKYL